MGLKCLGGDRPAKKKSIHPKKARVSEPEQREQTPISSATTEALPTTPPMAPPQTHAQPSHLGANEGSPGDNAFDMKALYGANIPSINESIFS